MTMQETTALSKKRLYKVAYDGWSFAFNKAFSFVHEIYADNEAQAEEQLRARYPAAANVKAVAA